MELDTVDIAGSPVKPSQRSEGCGQSVKYGNEFYFYRTPCFIPKNQPVIVRSESGYCGRVHGDVHYLIIAFNGKNFTVLKALFPGETKEAMKKFKGLTNQEAIALVEEEWAERERQIAAMPKCKCGAVLIRFEDKQRADECCSCFRKRISKKKKKHA